jgi:hypothetical protein
MEIYLGQEGVIMIVIYIVKERGELNNLDLKRGENINSIIMLILQKEKGSMGE